MTGTLQGRTVFITGASRGIGREIALRAARDGANVVIAAKSAEPHPKLPGTIHSVAQEVEAAGGKALPVQLDVRDDDMIAVAMEQAANRFGGIDVVVNNAGAIRLDPAEKIEMKRFDLIFQINTRAVLAVTKAALPYLTKSEHAHVLSLSPPINLDRKWLGSYIPYTTTKYAMTLLSLGMAEEFRDRRIGVNTLWPRTTIATAAVEFEVGAEYIARSRTPAIMAEAAHAILASDPSEMTGQALLDEEILRERGQTEFDQYLNDPTCTQLMMDLYVDD
ncbi:NAD(P)-dependent oxidoreductase [Phaeobacter sp. 22II1-1F12B]|uniref:SDR family oxidoreductase n=1 Tax=Phaeobacter sp. 22II1-1F12B TaxID=1317111 RepID=UPI000B523F56|nr:NAD(P)-dependent oxidoreductase [Phaeobacter sp. 22II1-1F12B]OWU78224.1 short-chain dehydrogenase [Phaeobacter sp. 22II1-1F12B]